MAKIKRRLTQEQEFQILRLVLDKFLWIGTAIMLFSLYLIYRREDIYTIAPVMAVGAVVLFIFVVIIKKEYEIIK